jgi:hypothetical protein
MKIKWKPVLLAVLAIVVVAVAIAMYGLSQGWQSPAMTGSSAALIKSSVDVSAGRDRVELLYFHRTERCTSCNDAEQYLRDTLDTYYADAVRSGRLSLQSIDYQNDRAMAEKYHVKVQGLKIRTIDGGQENVKNVPEIWSYVGDRAAYMGFMKSVIDKELG